MAIHDRQAELELLSQVSVKVGKCTKLWRQCCPYNGHHWPARNRWQGQGEVQKFSYSLYYTGEARQRMYGIGFILSKIATQETIHFELVNDNIGNNDPLTRKIFKTMIISMPDDKIVCQLGGIQNLIITIQFLYRQIHKGKWRILRTQN